MRSTPVESPPRRATSSATEVPVFGQTKPGAISAGAESANIGAGMEARMREDERTQDTGFGAVGDEIQIYLARLLVATASSHARLNRLHSL